MNGSDPAENRKPAARRRRRKRCTCGCRQFIPLDAETTRIGRRIFLFGHETRDLFEDRPELLRKGEESKS